jgi:hypothetical protein
MLFWFWICAWVVSDHRACILSLIFAWFYDCGNQILWHQAGVAVEDRNCIFGIYLKTLVYECRLHIYMMVLTVLVSMPLYKGFYAYCHHIHVATICFWKLLLIFVWTKSDLHLVVCPVHSQEARRWHDFQFWSLISCFCADFPRKLFLGPYIFLCFTKDNSYLWLYDRAKWL